MEENLLATIQNDHVVQIAYNLNVDGEEVESDLLEYLHGHGNIIPGLEQPLTGAKVGDKLEVIAKAAEAYGEFDPNSVITVSRESFPPDFEIRLGEAMRLRDGGSDTLEDVTGCIAQTHCFRVSLPPSQRIPLSSTSTTRWLAKICTSM